MTGRADVERAIIDDESMLERVAGLIERCVDVAEWPEDARGALALALTDDTMAQTEHWKTVTLRRHLFGPMGVVPEKFASMRAQSASARRRAEGLRAGLPARVRYRAAAYMLRAA